ncbi:dTMP kinase [Fodinibius salsisoli]|uniref:Thymidylate kinase n=1 Tax=Fodinibius salsisoli TaxID=2820877 RepID=A0ABT3PN96_9BACT|nr:dTMP kinase [Fodinibius salsisoli]
MFITFEGIDGSGKSTQMGHLKEALEREGARVEVFRDPGGPEVSERVRDILLNPDYKVDSVTELLLFSAARSQLVAEKLLPALEGGAVVILDRFFDSTTAYQGYGRQSVPLEEIAYLNRIASHKRTPDLTIYMKVPLGEAKKRIAKKQKDRMEQAGDDFFQKVITGFDEMAASHERFFTIDAMESEEEVKKKIWKQVQTHFSQR